MVKCLSLECNAWHVHVRAGFSEENKHNDGIGAFFQLIFAVNTVCALLPPELVANSDGLGVGGSARQQDERQPKSPEQLKFAEAAEQEQRAKKIMGAAYAVMLKLYPARYI